MNKFSKVHSESYFKTNHLSGDLKRRGVRGGAITILGQGINFLLRFGSTAILARILTPQDYGLVAMTLVIIGFANLFSNAGLSMATVQYQDIVHDQVSSLFWINVMLGCLITFILITISPLVSSFYDENKVRGITCWLSGSFILGGLTVQHQALLRRQMRFKELMFIDVFSMIISITTGIIMAFLKFQYWSIVGMVLSQHFTKMVAVWIAVPWKPSRPRLSSNVKSLLKFGGNIVWFNVVNYFSRHLDNLLIGRYWGAVQLGFYEKAYNLLLFPISQINTPIAAVVIPSLSRINMDQQKYKRYFLGVFKLVASIIIPIILIIAIFSDYIVEIWLGPSWKESAVLFRLLSVAALLGALSNPIGWLLISTGKTRQYRNIGMVTGALIVTGFICGLKFGTDGIAIGYSVAMIPATILSWVYGLKGTNIGISEVGKILLYPAIAGVFSSIISLIILSFLNNMKTSFVSAGLSGVVFCTLYSITLLLVFGEWPFYKNIMKTFGISGY